MDDFIEKMEIGLSSPSLALRKFLQAYNRIRYGTPYNPNGISVMDEDWDNLIILDACRYDLFEQHNMIDGTLRNAISRGASTPEFLRGNFHGRKLWDTVYVTANPMFYRRRDSIDTEFHAVLNVWRDDGWDTDLGTVRPKTMNEYARRANEKYPNKRLLLHYIQPHYPFITSDTDYDKGHLEFEDADKLSLWMQLKTGNLDVSSEEVWEAYAANLNLALDSVTDLVNDLTGRTVITADHGNMFGEQVGKIPVREWGHPRGIYTEELVKVPWLECEVNGKRRKITAEERIDEHDSSIDVSVTDRLSELGYME